MQKDLKLPEIKLKIGIDTRWTSHFDSLDRLIQCHQAVVNIGLVDQEVEQLSLSLEDWKDLTQIRDTLKPFTNIIEILQTSNSPSASMLKPLMSNIINNFLKITNQDGDYSRTIKHLMLESFLNRIKDYKKVNDLLLLTSIIDPRFKSLYYLEENEKLRAEELLKTTYIKYKNKYEDKINQESKIQLIDLKKTKLNQEAMLSIFKGSTSVNNTDIYKEVRNYLVIDEISILDNPLHWWKENVSNFKVLSIIAKDLLAIPATSAPSERIFSKAGNIISTKRSSLASKTIDPLIFLAENQKMENHKL